MADQVLEAVDTRMGSEPRPGSEVMLAGIPVGDGGGQEAQGLSGATLTGSELLANSSFALTSRTVGSGLLSRVTLEGLAASDTSGNDDLNQWLEFKFGYGFPAFGDRFTLTPELGLGLYDSGRDYRVGWRLTHLAETGGCQYRTRPWGAAWRDHALLITSVPWHPMGGWMQCRDAVPIFHPFGLECFVCQRVVLLNRLNPVHRTSIHSRFPSSPAEEGHSWVWRLLERVPTGQDTMSTILAMLDTELRAGGATTAVMVLVAAGVPLWSEVFGTPEARAENTVTLTASNVEIKTATLTISGHTGDWWYLREYPFPQPACASAGSSSTVNVTGLKASTRYLWHAYSDSGCSVAKRLTSSFTDFTTKLPVKPSAPTGLTAETGNTSVTLSWTPGDDGGAAITKWQYRQKAGEGAYGQWQDICSDCPSQTSHTISSLTNGTAYTFQVRAVNNVGNGTAASTTVTPLAALTVSGITTTGAKLTISDYTGNWYYKRSW